MPPRKPAKKNAAAKGYKLPDHIPPGQILTDITRKQWIMGKSIGQGGFGEIYLASNVITKPVPDNANFVIKIEPHSNGPLFTEMHCYMRIAKPEFIDNWKKDKKLKHLGMPKYMGSGSHEYNGQKYRFMVMERFGDDLQKIIEKHNKKFSYKTVYQVVIQILDVLEYIHSYEYIHADIKASNLLVGHESGTENKVFLVDYGLACRYKIDGKHKEYKYDQRKAHDGTIEFTSRDAHIGAHSRRGDIEILGYNLVQWLCGKLPWENNLQDCNYVANKKRAMMDDVPAFMSTCFPDGVPPGIQEFIEYVASLTFDEEPNYEKCKSIMREGLKNRGYKDDGKLVFLSATPKAATKPVSKVAGRKKGVKRRSEEEENIGETSPKKKLSSFGRSPCKPRNIYRFNTRQFPKDKEIGRSLSKPSQPEYEVESDDSIIEKENRKMQERKKKLRPKRIAMKKDTSLDNPTPQMLEIMAKMREKSISPPICMKRHRHNSNCQQGFRVSPLHDSLPSELTPAMEEVLKKRSDRRLSTESSDSSRISYSGSMSPDLFDSGDESEEYRGEEEDQVENEEEDEQEDEEEDDDEEDNDEEDDDEVSEVNATVYYSPCCSNSPSGDCGTHEHSRGNHTRVPIRNYSERRVSLSSRKFSISPPSGKGHRRKAKPKPTTVGRVTRSSSRNSTSPEVY